MKKWIATITALCCVVLFSAQSYAQVPYGVGDVNGDGRVDRRDVRALSNHSSGHPILSCTARLRADVNGDHVLDKHDLLRLSSNQITGIGRTLGDANEDGIVAANDLIAMQRHILGIESLSAQGQINADVNESAGISAVDLAVLQKCLLGFMPVLPAFDDTFQP